MRILLSLVFVSAVANADDFSLLKARTAADLIRSSAGVSMFRYSAFGLGSYPYRNAMPGTDLDVRFDGVPLASISPFGPDLDMIPASLVDTLSVSNTDIDITSLNPIGHGTKTDISFLQGVRRRFLFDLLYRHQLSETSGILFSGSSTGMHGNEYTAKSGYRSYFLKYARNLARGSMFVNFRGWRDRDSLVNVFKSEKMGERKSEAFIVSSGLRSFKITERIILDADIYFRDMYSRFDRYGSRRSLDDHEYGTRLDASTHRGKSVYGVELVYDGVAIDSRIHDKSFSRGRYSLGSYARWTSERALLSMKAAFRDHTEYDAGWFGSVDGTLDLSSKVTLKAGLENGVAYHDVGREIYSTLIFSDYTDTNPMHNYRFYSAYVGADMSIDIFNASFRIHQSKYAGPVFKPTTAQRNVRCAGNYLVDAKEVRDPMTVCSYGVSTSRDAFDGMGVSLDGFVRIDSDIGDFGTWPSPLSEVALTVDSQHTVYHDLIGLSVYGRGSAESWDEYVSNVDGTYYFLDCGIGLAVSKLELYYRIENIADENPQWFDTLGWVERNTMWGATWRFID